MATARAHVRIARAADQVWQSVTDPDGIQSWFPGVATSRFADGVRHVHTTTGIDVDEEIVTNDGQMRRFQYRILPGGAVPVEHHLATVDVLDDGDGALVVYSVDVGPEAFGPGMQQTVDAAVESLKLHVEQGG